MGQAYHIKSDQGIDLDEAMEVAKKDGDGIEHDVLGVATPKTNKLDDLGEGEHPYEFGNQGVVPGFRVPIGCAPPKGQQNQGVSDKGQRSEGGQVKGVSAPRLLATIPKMLV